MSETCFLQITVPKTTGGITLPAESGCEDIVKKLCSEWGADYIRDSDGTTLSPELLAMGFKIYSTVCLVRAEQKYPRQHMDQLPEKFLMSDPVTAVGTTLTIKPMAGFYHEKYSIDTKHDPKEYWQVIDRTSGEVLPSIDWNFNPETEELTINHAKPWHSYTVNFLVFQIWDTTSMYNHLTNNWTCEHIISVDPYHKECWDHLMDHFDKWLEDHKETDLVRLTTLAYHFTVDSNQTSGDKMRDWTGYQDTISVPALKDFEKEYGYKLTAEDFVDQGYYNTTIRVPSDRFMDWMEFIHKFVLKFGKELCRKSHEQGKTTGMFWGDHWVGTEPYLDSFEDMGIDVHIGACEDGVALRRISDTPGQHTRECRLYPYFFPDVFHEGGDPLPESRNNWTKIRRALLRKPIDRIGYGGYLSLAAKFPHFVQHVTELCDEFRAIKEMSGGSGSWKQPIKVAILSAWGKRRSWIPMHGPAQKFMVMRADAFWVAGSNLLECLSGLPVEVCFVSCKDIIEEGIPEGTNVIINDGAAETSWSGGRFWENPELVAKIREFVANGGGFIGCRGPSAQPYQGHYFQLFDVMGVEKEIGWSLQSLRIACETPAKHFITDDQFTEWDFGSNESWVFSCDPQTQILCEKENHIMLAVKDYHQGRSVYFSGLPFSLENSRMLYRALLWAAHKEESLNTWFSQNLACEVAVFEDKGTFAVVNNSDQPQKTIVYTTDAQTYGVVELAPFELKWFKI